MPGSRCGKFFSAPAKLLPKLVQDPMERWKSPRKAGKTYPLSSPLNVYLFLSSARFASQLEHTAIWHKLEFSNINKWNRFSVLHLYWRLLNLREFFTFAPVYKKCKVEKILKGSLNLISPPSPSVKIQIIGEQKVCWQHSAMFCLKTSNKLSSQ